nr:hypothetical protein [Nocardia amikacinitolerans]
MHDLAGGDQIDQLVAVGHLVYALDRSAARRDERQVCLFPVLRHVGGCGMPEVRQHLDRQRRRIRQFVILADGQDAIVGEQHRTDGEVGFLDRQPHDQCIEIPSAQCTERIDEGGAADAQCAFRVACGIRPSRRAVCRC